MNNRRIVKCNRCENDWATRTDKTPKYCPYCKSPYWNKPRIRPIKVKKT